jgi:threonine/homoserine/homoserine lactone efflux protein
MLDAVIKGLTLGLLLAISVGPIVFTVIKQSLNNGLKGGLAFITGIFLSDVFLVICCNFFTQFFKAMSNYDTQLGIAGSILLILVGVYFLFFKKVKVTDNGEQLVLFSRSDYAKMFFAGAIINLLNPGIIVFWFVWATAYISHTLNHRMVIFGTALLIAFSADIAKVVLADKIRKKLTPKNIHRINRINGLILIGFGIALLWGLIVYENAGGH